MSPLPNFPPTCTRGSAPVEYGRIEPRFVEAVDGMVSAERLIAAMDRDTAAVAVSMVDFHTGYRIDLAALREACGYALLVVDAVQGLGALQISMQHADVVVAGRTKWLRAGVGLAMMAVSPRAMERLDPVLSGWVSVEDPFGLEVPAPHAVTGDGGSLCHRVVADRGAGGTPGLVGSTSPGTGRGPRGERHRQCPSCRGGNPRRRGSTIGIARRPLRAFRDRHVQLARRAVREDRGAPVSGRVRHHRTEWMAARLAPCDDIARCGGCTRQGAECQVTVVRFEPGGFALSYRVSCSAFGA